MEVLMSYPNFFLHYLKLQITSSKFIPINCRITHQLYLSFPSFLWPRWIIKWGSLKHLGDPPCLDSHCASGPVSLEWWILLSLTHHLVTCDAKVSIRRLMCIWAAYSMYHLRNSSDTWPKNGSFFVGTHHYVCCASIVAVSTSNSKIQPHLTITS